ncbi:MAG: hypothetical protein NTZ93_02975 [Candidatus Beckwithbacteria bacterium]|nr:hypothetical protein [Candidatus Beckwithbacteria bacterium]
MKFLKNLFPHLIKDYHLPINGLIEVVMALNRPRLMIGGMIQSGGLVRAIWEKALKNLKNIQKKIDNVLIIGLGCGDCAFEVQKYYPEAQMKGLEIDDKVVEAAQCYFNLATVKNLKISIEDGAKYLTKIVKQKNKIKFDLVIIDAYLGKTMPKNFRTKIFFTQLKKILATNGVVIYNHLFFGEHKNQAKIFIKELENIFRKITLLRTASNLLIFGWQ